VYSSAARKTKCHSFMGSGEEACQVRKITQHLASYVRRTQVDVIGVMLFSI
jgi:hypothetical protein